MKALVTYSDAFNVRVCSRGIVLYLIININLFLLFSIKSFSRCFIDVSEEFYVCSGLHGSHVALSCKAAIQSFSVKYLIHE